MSIKHTLNQTGDTIVEVMFAVAIIGMVIGGSYVIATRSQRTGRYAQEQTEALKQAETQIERLKYVASQGLPLTDANSIFTNAAGKTTFCVSDTFTKVLQSDTTAVTGYAAKCTGQGVAGLYTILTTYNEGATPPGTEVFNVVVTWERQGSDQPGNVSIAYKLHNAPPQT